MDIIKDTLWLFPYERITILEIYKQRKLMYYQYAYQLEKAKGNWITRVVWHNFEQISHYDIYDESGKLLVRQEQEKKDVTEIVRLVKVFRKSLMNMDLTKI